MPQSMVSQLNNTLTQPHSTQRLLLRGTLAWKGGRQWLWDVRMTKELAPREHEALLDNTFDASTPDLLLLRRAILQSSLAMQWLHSFRLPFLHTSRDHSDRKSNTERHPALSVAGHQAWVMTRQGNAARRSTISSHKCRLAPSCPG